MDNPRICSVRRQSCTPALLCLFFSVLVVLLPLWPGSVVALGVSQQNAGLSQLILTAPRVVYRHGQTIEFDVVATQSMELTCYLEDSAGDIYQVFPNAYSPEGQIQALQSVRISGEGEKVRIVADGQQAEKVACVGHDSTFQRHPELSNLVFRVLEVDTLATLLKLNQSFASYIVTSHVAVIEKQHSSGNYVITQSVTDAENTITEPKSEEQSSQFAGYLGFEQMKRHLEGNLVLFGVFASFIGILAFFPYIRDIITGATQPHRASWLIWTVMSSIALFSQLYEGASTSLLYAGAQTMMTVLVFVLSVLFGSGKLLHKVDFLLLGVALVGLIMWYQSDSAVYALLCAVGISAIGGVAIAVKAFLFPDSETLSAWLLCLVGAVFGMLSVGLSSDWVLYVYPAYLLVLYAVIVLSLLIGRYYQRVRYFQIDKQAMRGASRRPHPYRAGSLPECY